MERYGNIEAVQLLAPEYNELNKNLREFAYWLVKAGLWGRDIIYDQNCAYNLDIRRILEEVFLIKPESSEENFKAYTIYLCEFWANNGLHNGRKGNKILPKFDREWFIEAAKKTGWYNKVLGEKGPDYISALMSAIFDPDFLAVQTSEDLEKAANNLYGPGVTTEEARSFYEGLEGSAINSRLVKDSEGVLHEEMYKVGSLYGNYLSQVVQCLRSAISAAGLISRGGIIRDVLEGLIKCFTSGEYKDYFEYNSLWAKTDTGAVDFIIGFTEVYLDGLGLKGTFESIIELDVRKEAQDRAAKLKQLAGEYNQLSPIPNKYRSQSISNAGMNKNIVALAFGGDSYPRAFAGVNLPNDPEIRATIGSKSATLVNIIESRLSNISPEQEQLFLRFYTKEQMRLRKKYFADAWELFVSMHELLGHGSGKLLEGVQTSSLKEHHSTIEEARADIYALYHIASEITSGNKLLPTKTAFKAIYDDYLISGLFTQLNSLSDDCIEIKEAHSRNRMLIARYIFEKGLERGVIKTTGESKVKYIEILDYSAVRDIIAELLNILQDITSTGNYEAACELIKKYVVLDPEVLHEVKAIYKEYDLPTERAYVNPKFVHTMDGYSCENTESFIEQNLRYSREYSLR